jgi:predicted ABC-class ATPase
VAASLVEAVEAGARILVLDEDEVPAGAFGAATALPGVVGPSDHLVSLTERFADLRDRWGVSFLVAARPSSALSVVADTVLVLRADGAEDVSEAVRATARTAGRRPLGTSGTVAPPWDRSLRIVVDDPAPGLKVAAWGGRGARVGDDLVDLLDTTAAGDPARLRAIAALLKRAAALASTWRPVGEVLDALEEACVRAALDELEEPGLVDLTRPSRIEIAAALVRWKRVSFRVAAGTLRPNEEDPS